MRDAFYFAVHTHPTSELLPKIHAQTGISNLRFVTLSDFPLTNPDASICWIPLFIFKGIVFHKFQLEIQKYAGSFARMPLLNSSGDFPRISKLMQSIMLDQTTPTVWVYHDISSPENHQLIYDFQVFLDTQKIPIELCPLDAFLSSQVTKPVYLLMMDEHAHFQQIKTHTGHFLKGRGLLHSPSFWDFILG